MSRNIVLSIALVLLRAVQFLLLVNILLLLVHLIKELQSGEEGYLAVTWELTSDLSRSFQIEPNQRLTAFAFYYNFTQSVLESLLYFAISFQVLQVLRSVRSFKTFMMDNVRRFRFIAMMILALSLINMFDYRSFVEQADASAQLKWSLDLWYVVFFMAAYLLAEIFKEGKRLAEEQNLIV